MLHTKYLVLFLSILLLPCTTAYSIQPSNQLNDSIQSRTAELMDKIANLEKEITNLKSGDNSIAVLNTLKESYLQEIDLLNKRLVFLKKAERSGLLIY